MKILMVVFILTKLNVIVLLDRSNSFMNVDNLAIVDPVYKAWILRASKMSYFSVYTIGEKGALKWVFSKTMRKELPGITRRKIASLASLKAKKIKESCPHCSDILSAIMNAEGSFQDVDFIIVITDGLDISPEFRVDLEHNKISKLNFKFAPPPVVVLTHIGWTKEGVRESGNVRKFWKAVGCKIIDPNLYNDTEFWVEIFKKGGR